MDKTVRPGHPILGWPGLTVSYILTLVNFICLIDFMLLILIILKTVTFRPVSYKLSSNSKKRGDSLYEEAFMDDG